jgi:hypothetical protein
VTADDAPHSGGLARRAARTVTSPVRGYLNDHFEMVKEEVRRVGASTPAPAATATGVSGLSDGSGEQAWARVAELENLLAEQAVHQARVMARVGDEVAALTDRVAELESLLRTVIEIVAAPAPDG